MAIVINVLNVPEHMGRKRDKNYGLKSMSILEARNVIGVVVFRSIQYLKFTILTQNKKREVLQGTHPLRL
tara:strand:+ start:4041 stop:4250 length:210 start_codon:yes stop_codon:yes gene_type:complete